MAEIAISVNHLNKTFGQFKAVNDLDFQVEKAECFGFLGPNGAGKTTTMKILYGVAGHDSHKDTTIDVFGYAPEKHALEIKSMSGIVPQEDNLDTELNVTDNLYIYTKFYGMPKKEAMARIEELLAFMELGEKARASVRELSGGMKRRLSIARGLINKPRLLILDEPTTGLDPQVRHLIWDKIRQLKQAGVTVLLTTHYMEEAYQICDRIIIMDKGRKIMSGRPRELLSENLERYVLEIYKMDGDKNACITELDAAAVRYEFHEDTLFAYSNDPDALTGIGKTLKDNDYDMRRSNLEDLFLKVTGRTLNELQ